MGKKMGFAAMNKEVVKKIASKGGKARAEAGTGHQYQAGSALARESGRKGGAVSQARRAAAKKSPAPVSKPLTVEDNLDNDDMSGCGVGSCGSH